MDEKEQKRIFANNLTFYMNKNGKTQSDLVRDLGINKSTVSTWCRGDKMPRTNTIRKIADYLNVMASDLILKADEKEINSIDMIQLLDNADKHTNVNDQQMKRLLQYYEFYKEYSLLSDSDKLIVNDLINRLKKE